MKTLTKIFAMALTLMMVLSLATVAFAANEAQKETGPFSVTVNNATDHSYKIYQIFTADLALDGAKEVLSNIKYGADYLPDGVTTDTEVPETVLDAVNAGTITITPTGNGTAMTTTGDKATATVEKAGYYMIVDVTDPLPGQDTRSAVIFQVVGETNITSKHTGTTIVKKVQDINDSTGEQPTDDDGSTWIDSADYDINDTVPFKVTSDFTGLTNYTTYKVIFTDIMAEGLTYKDDMKIYLMGTDENGEETKTDVTEKFDIVASKYTATATNPDPDYDNGTIITATCKDIIDFVGEDVLDATFVLEYSATLNNKAKLGTPGNPNKIKVKFMPDGEGDNETPWDVNIVFTYKVESNKYANEIKEGNELTGAGFTLFKWIKDDSDENGSWVQIGEEVAGEAMTKFEWKGIDDGKYKLVETKTPAGFNTIAPIEFEVKAEHVIVADNPTLTNLTGEKKTGEVTFTADTASGLVSTDIINNSGIELPETGGIGTTIFYIVGSLLAVAAVVLLVTKKRMNSAE